MEQFPYHNDPSDIVHLLEMLPQIKSKSKPLENSELKKLGFPVKSRPYLKDTLHKLGFLTSSWVPTDIWQGFVEGENKGTILAFAIKGAYPGLFDLMAYPYLEADEEIIAYFKQMRPKTSQKDLNTLLSTFRELCGLADFQEITNDLDKPADQPIKNESLVEVKADPHLQINLQIHIAADTPDETIKSIFKNMRKYLLNLRE